MRNYGRFTTSIHRDEDFRALTLAEQGLYFMLGLQPEVSAAGTLPLTLRRWANNADEIGRDDLSEMLSVLADRGHIIVDWDTEELLIVKFIKWDGGITNEKRRPVILEAGCAIESKRIRHRIAYEIARLGYTDMASRISEEGASEATSGFDRVVVTKGESVPQPTNPTPEPSSATHRGEPSPTALQAVPPLDDLEIGLEDPGPEPAPYCPKHMPNGPTANCGPCGDARRNRQRWQRDEAAYTKAFRRAYQRLIDECPDCDEHGRRLDPDTLKPIGACTHRQSA